MRVKSTSLHPPRSIFQVKTFLKSHRFLKVQTETPCNMYATFWDS